jgi:hypothetical protein
VLQEHAMLHELVPMMVINIQSHVKKSMIILSISVLLCPVVSTKDTHTMTRMCGNPEEKTL